MTEDTNKETIKKDDVNDQEIGNVETDSVEETVNTENTIATEVEETTEVEAIKEEELNDETEDEAAEVEDSEVDEDYEEDEQEMGVPTSVLDTHRSSSRDFGWESLASVEQSRQNEIISEIYDLMSNPSDEKMKALKAEWSGLPAEPEGSGVEARYLKAIETYDRRSENILGAYQTKKDLVNRAKQLETNDNFQSTARELQQMQKDWRQAGFSGKDNEETLWAEFRASNDVFFERRNKHFEEMNEKRDEAKALKEALILEVEEIKDSSDWKNTSREMNQLMNRWKKAGFAGRDVDDALWARFNGPRQEFYQRQSGHFDELNTQYDEAKTKKEAIIEKVRAILNDGNYAGNRSNMDALFAEWKEVGHSGRKNEPELWATFKGLQDEFFENLKNTESHNMEERREVMSEDLERLDVRISALQNLNDMIEVKLQNLANPSLAESVKEANREEVEQLNSSFDDNKAKLDEYEKERSRISRSLNQY